MICPVLALTGVPCPFCGMTRATLALARGDLDAALDAHPLAPLVLAGVIAILALALAGRADLLRKRGPLLFAALALVWAVKLAA